MLNTYIYIYINHNYDKYTYLTYNVRFVGIKEAIDKC